MKTTTATTTTTQNYSWQFTSSRCGPAYLLFGFFVATQRRRQVSRWRRIIRCGYMTMTALATADPDERARAIVVVRLDDTRGGTSCDRRKNTAAEKKEGMTECRAEDGDGELHVRLLACCFSMMWRESVVDCCFRFAIRETNDNVVCRIRSRSMSWGSA